MRSFENRRCLCVASTFYDNPSKCILHTLKFLHVKHGLTPQARIEMTTHQGICGQKPHLSAMYDPPDITHLNKTSFTNVRDMMSERKICIKPAIRLFFNECWVYKIT